MCIRDSSESKIEDEEDVDHLWNERALKFCNEGGVIGSSQRESLWRVVENFREVFADIPGRARNYECELKVREHAPYVQRSYPVPYAKRRAVQIELEKMLEGDIIERSVSPVSYTHLVIFNYLIYLWFGYEYEVFQNKN